MQTTRILTRRHVISGVEEDLSSKWLVIYLTGSEQLRFGRGSSPIHFKNVNCSGTEKRLVSCSANPTSTNNNCDFAGVRCQPGELAII